MKIENGYFSFLVCGFEKNSVKKQKKIVNQSSILFFHDAFRGVEMEEREDLNQEKSSCQLQFEPETKTVKFYKRILGKLLQEFFFQTRENEKSTFPFFFFPKRNPQKKRREKWKIKSEKENGWKYLMCEVCFRAPLMENREEKRKEEKREGENGQNISEIEKGKEKKIETKHRKRKREKKPDWKKKKKEVLNVVKIRRKRERREREGKQRRKERKRREKKKPEKKKKKKKKEVLNQVVVKIEHF